MTTTQGIRNDIYLLPRDHPESARLDEQHTLFVNAISGENSASPIHTTITKNDLKSVADVATGTGVWLFAVKEELDLIPSSSAPRYFHAFDISASQFPGSASLPFSIQNIVDPFPPEHHCRYDLVHVRLLIAALRADQYASAVANLSQLLKPGGYIQGDDFDVDHFTQTKKDDFPLFSNLCRVVEEDFCKQGKVSNPSLSILKGSYLAGLVEICQYHYSIIQRPEIHMRAQKWALRLFQALLPSALQRLHLELDQCGVQSKVSENLARLQQDFEAGVIPSPGIIVVIARRPLISLS